MAVTKTKNADAFGIQVIQGIASVRSAAKISNTGSTTENTLLTKVIPGGTVGPLDVLRMTMLKSAEGVSNANSKTFRIKLNGLTVYSDGFASALSGMATVYLMGKGQGSQIAMAVGGSSGGGNSANAPLAYGIDFTQDVTLTVTNQLGVATDTASIEQFIAEVIRA